MLQSPKEEEKEEWVWIFSNSRQENAVNYCFYLHFITLQ